VVTILLVLVSIEIGTRRFEMKGKYLRRIGGLMLATLMLAGIVFVSPGSVEAQRRIVIVRPYPFRFYQPWGYSPWGYYPWSPYGNYYGQYVFDSGQSATNQGYKDGFKTGNADGKKNKSFSPERSHYYQDAGFGNYAEVYRSGFSRGYQEGYRVGNSRAG
jgi:hypothetical protein